VEVAVWIVVVFVEVRFSAAAMSVVILEIMAV